MNIRVLPTGGLLEALGLPQAPQTLAGGVSPEMREQFLAAMESLKRDLQVAASIANPADVKALDTQRNKLYEAFQTAAKQAQGATGPQAGAPMQKVIAAVGTVATKASQLVADATKGRGEWDKRSAEFDEVLVQVGDLEDAGHPKAATMRKLTDAIQGKVNQGSFGDSVQAFDQMRPKFQEIAAKPAEDMKVGLGLEDLIDIIPHSKRSVITIKNSSTLTLQLVPGSAKPESKGASIKGSAPNEIPPNGEGSFEVSNSLLGPIPVPVGTGGSVSYLVAGDPDGTRLDMRWENGYLLPSKDTFPEIKPKNESKFRLTATNRDDDFTFVFAQQGTPGPGPTPGPTPAGPDAASGCMITVTNKTQLTLTLVNQGHERGDFMTFPDKDVLKPGESARCVSVETPNAKEEGCKGFLLWQVGDPNTLWRVEWDNPEGAKNSAVHAFNPANATFNSLNQIGQGEENVPTSFTLSGGGGVVPPTQSATLPILVINEVDDQPIPDATVTFGDVLGTTDGQGKCVVELPPGDQECIVGAQGFDPTFAFIVVTPGPNKEFVIKMRPIPGARQGLTVVVKDKSSGQPIEAATVKVADQTDTTSASGLATVEVPVGKQPYSATAQGYQSANGDVDIIDGDNPELVIELESDGKQAPLAVIVVDDATGDVIPGATVKVGDKSETTSKAGLVVLTLAPGSHPYDVSAAGFESANGQVEVAEGDNNELEVRLKKAPGGTKVEFTVVDAESGEPLSDAAVSLGDLQSTKTDANGQVTFDVEAGQVPYMVEKEGYESTDGLMDAAADTTTKETVKLKKSVAKGTVTFTVVDADTGTPLEGATIYLDRDNKVTDAQGVAQFEAEARPLVYAALKQDYEDQSGDVEPKEGQDTPVLVKMQGFNPPPESAQPTLRLGDKSPDGWVEYLQKLLNRYLGANTVKEDGNFDQSVKDAVLKFQGLPQHQPPQMTPGVLKDGVVGNETWSMLRKGPREAVGTDKRKPHEFEEKGAEGRWGTEREDFVSYDAKDDVLRMIAFSVGEEPLEKFKAVLKVKSGVTGESRVTSFPLTLSADKAPDGAGQAYFVQHFGFSELYGAGKHTVDAYLPQELGGDRWTGEVDASTGPGNGGGGGGGTVDDPSAGGGKKPAGGGKKPSGGGKNDAKTGMLRVIVEDEDENRIEGAIVSITGADVDAKTSNAKGMVEFADMPIGTYEVIVVSADGSTQRVEKSDVEAGDDGSSHYIVLGETYGATLDVGVYDQDNNTHDGVLVKMLSGGKVVHEGLTDSGYVQFKLVGHEIEQKYTLTAAKNELTWTPIEAGPFEPYAYEGVTFDTMHVADATAGKKPIASEERAKMLQDMQDMQQRLSDIMAKFGPQAQDIINKLKQ